MSEGCWSRCGSPENSKLSRYEICSVSKREDVVLSLVRLLGFTTLDCGCAVGRYREIATRREIAYVEEKGARCTCHAHRRNHTLPVQQRRSVPAWVPGERTA